MRSDKHLGSSSSFHPTPSSPFPLTPPPQLLTMRRITVIRHAKSSWTDSSIADDQRPLNQRGKDSAPMMGERLAAQGMTPDLLFQPCGTHSRQPKLSQNRLGTQRTQSILMNAFNTLVSSNGSKSFEPFPRMLVMSCASAITQA